MNNNKILQVAVLNELLAVLDKYTVAWNDDLDDLYYELFTKKVDLLTELEGENND